MTTRSAAALFTLSVATLLALSGCTPPVADPTPTPSATGSTAVATATATPTPTPTPTVAAPVPTTIIVSGTSITVLDETSATIVDIPFTMSGDAAAEQLIDALGATPDISTVTAGSCRREGTIYDFGGFELDAAGTITMAPPAVFSVRVKAPSTSAGVAVRGPAGVQVGQSAVDVIAAIPSADDVDSHILVLEFLGGSGPDITGVEGYNDGGTITGIFAPVYIFGDC
jgi:hypothetical protein